MVRVDVSAALLQRAGVARYTRELAHALWDTAGAGHRRQLGFFAVSGAPSRHLLPPAPIRSTRLSPRQWRTLLLAGHMLARPLAPGLDVDDLFHATDVAYPWAPADSVLVTVHDLSVIRFPALHSPGNRFFQTFMLRALRRRGHRILTVSDFTRRELCSLLMVDPSRVSVSYPGVAPVFCAPVSAREARSVRARYDLRRPFVLTVATHEPRKNLQTLLAAFAQLNTGVLQLAVVGSEGWGEDKRLAQVARPGVHFLGYVQDNDLRCLYREAAAFVYPSLYEGFGSPILEAMACGAAVVCSPTCGAVEVAKGAVRLIDSLDRTGIAAAIADMLETDTAAMREQAQRCASAITYTATALAHWRAYQELVGG